MADITARIVDGELRVSFTGKRLVQTGHGEFTLEDIAAASGRAPAVFWDSEAGDKFTDLIYANFNSGTGLETTTPDAALTLAATGAQFNSATPKDLLLYIPHRDGSGRLLMGLDEWEVDVTVELTSAPSDGLPLLQVGPRYYVPASADSQYGMHLASHTLATNSIVEALIANTRAEVSGGDTGNPVTYRMRARHDQGANFITHTVNIDGGGDIIGTEAYDAFSRLAPDRLMYVALRFKQGNFTVKKFKFSSTKPNVDYAILAHSWGVGYYASPAYTNGFAQLFKSNHPASDVLIDAGSGATALQLKDALKDLLENRPRVVFMEPTVNSFVASVPVAQIQTAVSEMVAMCQAAGAIPVVLECPPIGNANVPTYNAWLATQNFRVLPIFNALVAGDGLNLRNDYKFDTNHANTAGHAALEAIISDYVNDEGV